jgi:hypothetical protein
MKRAFPWLVGTMAGIAVATLLAAASPASAGWRGHGGYGHHHHGGFGRGLGGFVAGAIIGGVFAHEARRYYAPPPVYYVPPPRYTGPQAPLYIPIRPDGTPAYVPPPPYGPCCGYRME